MLRWISSFAVLSLAERGNAGQLFILSLSPVFDCGLEGNKDWQGVQTSKNMITRLTPEHDHTLHSQTLAYLSEVDNPLDRDTVRVLVVYHSKSIVSCSSFLNSSYTKL